MWSLHKEFFKISRPINREWLVPLILVLRLMGKDRLQLEGTDQGGPSWHPTSEIATHCTGFSEIKS